MLNWQKANFLVMNANAILKRVATNRVGRQYQKGANSTGRGRGGGGQATAKRSLERQNIEEMNGIVTRLIRYSCIFCDIAQIIQHVATATNRVPVKFTTNTRRKASR